MCTIRLSIIFLLFQITCGWGYVTEVLTMGRTTAWHITKNSSAANSSLDVVQQIDAFLGIAPHSPSNFSLLPMRVYDEAIDLRFAEIRRLLHMTNHHDSKELDDFLPNIKTINEFYRYFRKAIEVTHNPFNVEWVDSPNNVIVVINEKLRELHRDWHGTHDGLPMLIARTMNKSHEHQCGNTQSGAHILMSLHETLMIAELQAACVLGLAYNMLLVPNNKGIVNTKADFEKRFHDYLETFIAAMEIVPGDMRACDPEPKWIRDETYFEAEKFVQTSILQPVSSWTLLRLRHYLLSTDRQDEEVCKDLAERSRTGDVHLALTDDRLFCHGYADKCQPMNNILEGCLPDNSVKRLEWLKLDDFRTLGQNYDKCDNGRKFSGNTRVETKICACQCFAKNNWIALGLVNADYQNNMVVTGLRLVRENNIFYLQVKQGKLLPGGKIDPASEMWLDLPKEDTVKYPLYRGSAESNPQFIVSDLIAPHGSLVVGAGFVNQNDNDLFLVRLRTMKFDFMSGKVLQREPHQDIDTVLEHSIDLIPGSINSIYADARSIPLSTTAWVPLIRSSLESDVGQSTLPLFDGVPVETNPPSALGGVGFIHKGTPGYGGFFSLRLHSLAYGEYLNVSSGTK
ncbi:uncharacterized protein LOC135165838 [Diachasmimorpha longicaudata]|uniref:uncharacterized protein LOC135165838 n=1 Tax=Diachasmimorpha longicaudata TaxID=58733 RepID=UPI0030B87075